jgi:PKD repeat protein
MRKLYAFLAGILFFLANHQSLAQTIPTTDVANFSFTVDADNNTVAFTNTSVLSSLAGDRRAHWSFGDGSGQWTLPLANTHHQYTSAGTYTVCLKIFRYVSNTNDSVLSAQVCKQITIPVRCRADFERLPVTANSPLTVGFKALPWNNAHKKPSRICWTFGDGRDTCINYPENYTGLYTVTHRYNQPGTYQVCVKILYYGGCLAAKCKSIVIERPDECRADFEKLSLTTSNSVLHAVFKALPWHNNQKKPARICWSFGDGRDTCISYTNSYTGPYTVAHLYNQPGVYEVCVKIFYYGGCEARKCKPVQIGPRPDSCRADFERLPLTTINSRLNVYYKALPWHNNNKKPKTICWKFGDGRDTCISYPENYTGSYVVRHQYRYPGLYEVCVKILYYGGCEARKCKAIQIGKPDECRADFERIPVIDVNDPFKVAFKALPWHNNNRKPKTICWKFGDGRDTCIEYPENYTGPYAVRHRYNHAGIYEVCVRILYYGGCEAKKCKEIRVGNPATCTADFERAPVIADIPHIVGFKALPWNSQNRKPARICWTFGDGRDTCISYPENYSGQYVVGHQYLQPGQYEVCVKIIYYGGCEAKKCKEIQVGPSATCKADFERAPLQNNDPLTIGLKAVPWNSQNRKPARICWSFGDGRDTCINYPDNYTGLYVVGHRYTQPGNYEVCVKIIYYGGCEARKCKEITIPPPTVECRVKLFEITPSVTSLVRGFYAIPSSSPDRRVERVCWDFGDGDDTCIMIQSTDPTQNLLIRHTYPAPGVYRACVKVKFVGGCEAHDCVEVVIRPASDICGGFMIDSLSGPRTYKFTGHSINRPNDEVIGYRWTFGDGSSATGRVVTHTYAQAGDYQVCLYIKTRLGCETRICNTVRVPGNNEPQLQLTPNPVINTVTVNFRSTHTETVNIKIVNSNGVPVRSYTRSVTVGPNTWSHDLSSLLTGVYSYNIHSPNQQASVIFLKN